MLRDKCVLNEFESMLISALISVESISCKILYEEFEYILISLSVNQRPLKLNIVLRDDSYQIRRDFQLQQISDVEDIEICDDKTYIELYMDLILHTCYPNGSMKCMYRDQPVNLLTDELYYHPEYGAVFCENRIQFICSNDIEKLTPLVTEMNPQVNEHRTNVLLKGHIKSDEEMKSYGFKRIDHEMIDKPYWSYSTAVIPDSDIEFYIGIFDDGTLRIDVLDDKFCQPYDYQRMMNDNPYYMFPRKVFWEVDKIMHRLQDDGFISEYHTGMYV